MTDAVFVHHDEPPAADPLDTIRAELTAIRSELAELAPREHSHPELQAQLAELAPRDHDHPEIVSEIAGLTDELDELTIALAEDLAEMATPPPAPDRTVIPPAPPPAEEEEPERKTGMLW